MYPRFSKEGGMGSINLEKGSHWPVGFLIKLILGMGGWGIPPSFESTWLGHRLASQTPNPS